MNEKTTASTTTPVAARPKQYTLVAMMTEHFLLAEHYKDGAACRFLLCKVDADSGHASTIEVQAYFDVCEYDSAKDALLDAAEVLKRGDCSAGGEAA